MVRAADINVPVLVVHELADGKLEGSLHTCTVSVTNRKVQKPLAVSVIEDAPSAVGAQMRAAVWLAATTVALERGDPLTGYRIDIGFDGSFDGPSAGGVVALALLCALDQRVLPEDFAFTGTILPNGGVGQVGGVAQKTRAAAKAGKKRILVPDFYRVETDPNSGEKVDFKDLCESLGLEYLPISHLREAYRVVFQSEAVQEPRSALKLSPGLEKFLKESYDREIKVGDGIFKALPEAEQNELMQDGFGKIFIKARTNAENAMREGNYSLAEENAVMWSALLSARKRNQIFLSKLKPKTSGDVIDGISREIDKAGEELVKNLLSYARLRSWTNKAYASELDDYCRELPTLLGFTDLLSFQLQPLMEERKRVSAVEPGFWDRFKSGPSREEQLEALDQQMFPLCLAQLLFLNAGGHLHESARGRMEKLSAHYPEHSPAPQSFHMECENLVYAASVAADESFTAGTIQEMAKLAGLDIDEAKARLALHSLPYFSLVSQRELCAVTYQNLKGSPDFYSIVLATQDHGFALAAATRMALTVQCGTLLEAEGVDASQMFRFDAGGGEAEVRLHLVRHLLEFGAMLGSQVIEHLAAKLAGVLAAGRGHHGQTRRRITGEILAEFIRQEETSELGPDFRQFVSGFRHMTGAAFHQLEQLAVHILLEQLLVELLVSHPGCDHGHIIPGSQNAG
jgi:hypothetical protein